MLCYESLHRSISIYLVVFVLIMIVSPTPPLMPLFYISNLTQEHIMSVEEAIKRLPVIGYVPRGTGNGLGHVVGCWQLPGVHEATQDDDDRQRKSNQLRLNLISRGKQRRQERTKRLLLRLKEVGDLIQNQRTESWSGAIGSFPDTKQKSAQANRNIHAQDNLADKYTIVEMPMMEVIHEEHENGNTCTASSSKVKNNKGDLCFFAGSGFDSLMLHDFQQIKAWSRTSKTLPTFIKDALSSVAGYCVALVTLTLPQTLRYGTHKIHVKVTTDDDETLWVDHRRGDFSELAVAKTNNNSTIIIEETINGNIMRKKRQQHLLYSGSTGILAASTTPYYGGGLRLFPYARLIPNKLQLRLGRISPLVGFFNIPKIFEGSYREKSDSFGCLDFIGDEFDVEVSSPVYEEYLKRRKGKRSWWKRIRGVTTQEEEAAATTNGEDIVETETATSGFPFQHSGESMGIKERFRLRVVKQPVRFVSFLQPRVIVDE